MRTTSREPGKARCADGERPDLDRADHVDYFDVERRLREALPWERADVLVARARDLGIPALMMWHWLEWYDADLLVLAIGSADTPPAPRVGGHLRLV